MDLLTHQGQRASILGLAAHQQITADSIPMAFDGGINYFFFYNLESENFLDGLKSLVSANHEQVLVATGSKIRDIGNLRRYLDEVRDRLNIDQVDVFFAEYIAPSDDMTKVQTVLDELRSWKQKGLVRYIGATTHNRPIASKLLERGQCEVLMHRYNMAHRKPEQDVLKNAQKTHIPIVAFTCTRWGSLLAGHPLWKDKPPTAADCYRYVLHHSGIRLALTAPQTRQQLQENLSVLHAPPLSSQEIHHWQQYGDLIYGSGQDAFDTQWL